MFFVVDKHLRNLTQQNCRVFYKLSIKKTFVPSAHDVATVLPWVSLLNTSLLM